MDKDDKINLFLDVDDTIFLSSERIIEMINEKYSITPPKSYSDLRDWGYKSIYPISTEECEELYCSPEFFKGVRIDNSFLDFYEKHLDDFNYILVTKGSPENLRQKEDYFKTRFPAIKFIGIPHDIRKSDAQDMTGGIFVDDVSENIKTSTADVNILLKRSEHAKWADEEQIACTGAYVCRNWKQISALLEFVLGNKRLFFASSRSIPSDEYYCGAPREESTSVEKIVYIENGTGDIFEEW